MTDQTLDMPVVRNGETGLELLANNAEHFIRRTVAEADFEGHSDAEASGYGYDTRLLPRLLSLANLSRL